MLKSQTIFNKKKEVVLFAYGYACQLCGLVYVGNHVHHNDRIHGNNDAFNMVPLCNHCHKMVHKARATINIQPTPQCEAILRLLNELFGD